MILGSVLYTKPEALGANSAISALTAKTTLQGDDTMVIVDNSGTPTTKKITVTNATTSMKAYNDLTYSPIFSTSAGLAALLSDETGSGGGFVRATNPTVTSLIVGTTATITDPHFDLSGTEAKGDIVYFSDAGATLSRLAIGSSGNLLTVSGGVPAWTDISSGNSTFGFIRTSGLLSIASSTIYGLTVGDSLAATTTDNLVVENNASTTNLTVSQSVNFTGTSTFIGWATSTGYHISSVTDSLNFNTSDWVDSTTYCATGYVVIGGGIILTTAGDQAPSVHGSGPVGITGWRGVMRSGSGTSAGTATIYAICVKA